VNKSNFDLFVIEIDTQEVTRITELSGDDTTPAWSPDGEYIGFQSSPGNIGETLISTIIAIVRSDGSEPPTAVTTDLANDRCPVWTNDGDGILFTSDRKAPFESSDIYLISPSDGNLIQLTTTEGGETCPLNFVSFEQTIENTMP
jgi:Tol biopolymer transport system component